MKNQTYRMTMLYDFYGELLTERQREFFDLYYNEDLSLSQISDVTGYNPTYLSRLFKEQTGETLIRYITRKRMDHITMLMKDPQLSMQQIMESAGFTTRSYFNQFIKKETGLTPKQYRMRLGTQLPE